MNSGPPHRNGQRTMQEVEIFGNINEDEVDLRTCRLHLQILQSGRAISYPHFRCSLGKNFDSIGSYDGQRIQLRNCWWSLVDCNGQQMAPLQDLYNTCDAALFGLNCRQNLQLLTGSRPSTQKCLMVWQTCSSCASDG